MTKQLSRRQLLFVHHYLESLNARDAARKAGYSDVQPERQGVRLLRNPSIKSYIARKLDEVLDDRTELVKAKVLKLWETIAFDKIEKVHALDPREVSNMLKASELLAKYLKMLEPDTNINLNIGNPENVNLIVQTLEPPREKAVDGESQ